MTLRMLYNKTTILTLLLVLALLLSLWTTQASIESNTQHNDSKKNTRDAFMTHVNYTSYGEHGNWESKFYSPHLDQYGHQKMTVLQQPILHTMGEENLTWKISAKSAVSYQALDNVILQDNVEIERDNHATTEKTLMHTTIVTLYPKEKYLATDAPVTIREPNNIVEAIGLEADLNTGDIQLSSNMKGVYGLQDR